MPIANLTNVPKSFLKLGQIRKGAPKGQNMPGKDLDYFRVTYLKGNSSLQIENAFRSVYGEKPDALNVRFADHEIESVWDANYECYKQGGLVAKAGSTVDRGLYWIFYREPVTMETLISDGRPRNQAGAILNETPINLDTPIYKNKAGDPFFLEPVGRLKVVIPEVAEVAVGFFEFRPESPRDIRNISAELAAFDSIARQYRKTIAGIPFILRRREEDVPARIDGKLVAKKSWVIHLDVSGEWGARAISVLERLALPEIIEGEAHDIPQLENGEVYSSEDYAEPIAPIIVPAPRLTTSKDRIWTVAQKKTLIDAKLANNDFSAKGMLDLSSLPADATEAEILYWGTAYRSKRGFPKTTDKDVISSVDAAKYADTAMAVSA